METTKIIDTVRARFNHHESKKYLEEKYTGQLIVVEQGGTWNISAEFLAMLRSLPEYTILLDIYRKPVKVNVNELLESCEQIYTTVMEKWLSEFTELSRKR